MPNVPSSAGERSGNRGFCRLAVLLSLLQLSVPYLTSGDNIDYLKWADGLLASGRVVEAIENYTRAIQANPSLTGAYVNRGYAYGLRGDPESAMADLNRAIEMDSRLAEAYLNRGILLKKRGDIDAAIRDYDEAIRLDSELTGAYYGRGEARFLKGDVKEAIADFDRVIARRPTLKSDAFSVGLNTHQIPRAHVFRGLAWQTLGEHGRAMADFSTAIRLDPKSAVAFTNRGNLHQIRGDLGAAEADYKCALELDPSIAEVYFNAGMAHRAQGEFREALADFDRLIELHPSAPAYDMRALVRRDLADLSGALEDLDRAIALDPRSELALFHRAETLYLQGDFVRAIDYYRKCEEIDGKLKSQAKERILEIQRHRAPVISAIHPSTVVP